MVEYRLYYDDKGNVICYTNEKLEGNYITIDAQTHAEARMDLKVLEGRIVRSIEGTVVTRLVPSMFGTRCASEDMCIVVPDDYLGGVVWWQTEQYEYKYN